MHGVGLAIDLGGQVAKGGRLRNLLVDPAGGGFVLSHRRSVFTDTNKHGKQNEQGTDTEGGNKLRALENRLELFLNQYPQHQLSPLDAQEST